MVKEKEGKTKENEILVTRYHLMIRLLLHNIGITSYPLF